MSRSDNNYKWDTRDATQASTARGWLFRDGSEYAAACYLDYESRKERRRVYVNGEWTWKVSDKTPASVKAVVYGKGSRWCATVKEAQTWIEGQLGIQQLRLAAC